MPPAASVDFTSVMLFVHVLAVIVAFGVTFAYPVLVPFVRRTNPRMLPTLFAAQYEIGRKLIVPGQIVVLVTGFYLSGKL